MWIKVNEVNTDKWLHVVFLNYFYLHFFISILIIVGVEYIACCCRASRWSKRA